MIRKVSRTSRRMKFMVTELLDQTEDQSVNMSVHPRVGVGGVGVGGKCFSDVKRKRGREKKIGWEYEGGREIDTEIGERE